MNISKTSLNDCFVLEPVVFGDQRGFFFESFNQTKFQNLTKANVSFVQDNHSKSQKNVLRGLHYQLSRPQGKLVRVTVGEVFDVAVDLRKSSSTFGKWFGISLSEENKKQIWVPAGFAHGFYVTSAYAEVQYKTTDYYSPADERCVIWDDGALGIKWPGLSPILSEKDKAGTPFLDCSYFL